jgi:hypothetical protein
MSEEATLIKAAKEYLQQGSVALLARNTSSGKHQI